LPVISLPIHYERAWYTTLVTILIGMPNGFDPCNGHRWQASSHRFCMHWPLWELACQR
jgi:hypothetical protein